MRLQRLQLLLSSISILILLTNAIIWETDLFKGQDHWRSILEGASLQYAIIGLFNIESGYLDTENRPESLNIADGVILVEAMRYAIKQVNKRNVLKVPIAYQITDCEESRSQFSRYQNIPVLIGLTSWQTSYYLLTNQKATGPIINPIASSSAFDHPPTKERKHSSRSHSNLWRTVSSDELEVQAIVHILMTLKWNYISVVSSNDLRTQETVEKFAKIAFKHGVCIATTMWLSILPDDVEYRKIAKSLAGVRKSNVAVLFTTGSETMKIIKSAPQLTYVTWSGFRASKYEIKSPRAAKGLIALQHANTYDKGFANYFMQLTLNNNGYSWFAEFWSEVFNCRIPEKYSILSNRANDSRPSCTGNERLHESFVDIKYALIKPVINAIETIACALKIATKFANCSNKMIWRCREEISKLASKYIGMKGCDLENDAKLNQLGYSNRGFTIVNFNGTHFKETGSWHFNETSKESHFSLDTDELTFKLENKTASSCYQPCRVGEIADRGPNKNICCFKCKKCSRYQVTTNNTCVRCFQHTHPNANRTACVKSPKIYLNVYEKNVWVLLIFAGAGIFMTTVIIARLIRSRNNGVENATGREFNSLIFVALYSCFVTSSLYFIEPNLVVCSMRRFALALSLNGCYTPLLLRTARKYRIFHAAEMNAQKPSDINTKSQFLICLGLLLGQFFLGVAWVFYDKPEVLMVDIEDKTAIICKLDSVNAVFNLLPCLLLMAACTFFGYKTRNFYSNLNEAYSISITTFVSTLLWAAFIPLLFLFQSTGYDVFLPSLLLATFMVIFGLVTVIGIFAPTLLSSAINKSIETEAVQRWNSQGSGESFNIEPRPSTCQVHLQNRVILKEVGTDPIKVEICCLCAKKKGKGNLPKALLASKLH